MRLLIPEIAWHETLPIYSCDLQPRHPGLTPVSGGQVPSSQSCQKPRQPLSDLPIEHEAYSVMSSDKRRLFDTESLNWTRLATAGGDKVIRLWRVDLEPVSACCKVSHNLDAAKPAPVIGPSSNVSGPLFGNCAPFMGISSGVSLSSYLADSQPPPPAKRHSLRSVECTSVPKPTEGGLIFLTSLRRHEKPVNVVRWSPTGEYLASAGDDFFVIIWAQQSDIERDTLVSDKRPSIQDEDDEVEMAVSKEVWLPCRSLRRHLEDIYDICWSPDSRALLSGSVDHSAIIWTLEFTNSSGQTNISQIGSGNSNNISGQVEAPPRPHSQAEQKCVETKIEPARLAIAAAAAPAALVASVTAHSPASLLSQANVKTLILRDHKHYVQGVAWDPLGLYVATLGSDRSCRVYRAGTANCLAHIAKVDKQRLFQDDSWKSFFRRLSFSPDGLILACPSGNLESAPFAGISADPTYPCAGPNDLGLLTTSSGPSLVSISTNIAGVMSDNAGQQVSALPQHAAHLFLRVNFSRPVVSLPSGSKPVVAVRFCPQPFTLRPLASRLFDLPYRWLFCLVLEDSLLFYDTQQLAPFAQVGFPYNCFYKV